jgi:adenine deaminase
MKIAEMVQAASGKVPLDLVIRNVHLINVFTCEIYPADIGIYKNRIAALDLDGSFGLEGLAEIDGSGKWAAPGFVDAHLHIESSMVTPANYAAAVLPHGVTTAIVDPHELANVMGKDSVRYVIESSAGLPLRVLVTVPSSVPSVPGLETAGAEFNAEDIREMLSWERVIGVGELMNYVGIANGDPRSLGIVQAGSDAGRYLQGHAPRMTGRPLQAYASTGIRDDHEARSAEEFIEKMRLGMRPLLRVGSENHYLGRILPGLKSLPFYDQVGVCTDDVFPDVSLQFGHMDFAVREIIAQGIDPARAIRWATLNNAHNAGLGQVGALAPGYLADIVLLSSLEEVKVSDVIADGQIVLRAGRWQAKPVDESDEVAKINTVKLPPLSLDNFMLVPPIDEGEVEVNTLVVRDDGGYPSAVRRQAVVEAGQLKFTPGARLVNLLTVVPRHGQQHPNVVVPVEGLDIQAGALATTISHDSHNLIVAGSHPEDMHLAVTELAGCGGGIVVVQNGGVLARVDLPIAGLLSLHPIETVAAELDAAHRAALQIGMPDFKPNAATVLNYLALIVIPEVRISDLGGLFDVEKQEFIPVFP